MQKLAGDAQASDPDATARLQVAASKTRRQADLLRHAAMEHTPIDGIAG